MLLLTEFVNLSGSLYFQYVVTRNPETQSFILCGRLAARRLATRFIFPYRLAPPRLAPCILMTL